VLKRLLKIVKKSGTLITFQRDLRKNNQPSFDFPYFVTRTYQTSVGAILQVFMKLTLLGIFLPAFFTVNYG
ncbi:MAG: hypothetical protein L0J63_01365, partial [Tetragenococcus koreensis]|nr:hypothetical protein [Tetragenococcus koreensis]